ncbi:hypothetical protein EV715DRAFT_297558 [Schizophyllum commune]
MQASYGHNQRPARYVLAGWKPSQLLEGAPREARGGDASARSKTWRILNVHDIRRNLVAQETIAKSKHSARTVIGIRPIDSASASPCIACVAGALLFRVPYSRILARSAFLPLVPRLTALVVLNMRAVPTVLAVITMRDVPILLAAMVVLAVPIPLSATILLVFPHDNGNLASSNIPSVLVILAALSVRHLFGLTTLAVPILPVDLTLRIVQLLRAVLRLRAVLGLPIVSILHAIVSSSFQRPCYDARITSASLRRRLACAAVLSSFRHSRRRGRAASAPLRIRGD